MLTKILCCALISVVAVQSHSVPGSTNVQLGNQDLQEYNQPVHVHVNRAVGKEGLNRSKVDMRGFLTTLHDAAIEAIDDAVQSFSKEIASIAGIVRATINAIKTTADAEAKIVASIPKVGIKALGGFNLN